MKTFREQIAARLESRGLWKEDAQTVVALAESDPICEPFVGRWDEDASNYPAVANAALSMSVDTVALRWIDENAPNAWYRPMFDRAVKA